MTGFQKGIEALEEIELLFTKGIVSCVPQMLEELEAARRTIEYAITQVGEGATTNAYYSLFSQMRDQCHESIYEWGKERGLKKEIGKYAHHWTRRHNQHLDKRKLGGKLETDKHLITATIVRGLEGEACLVTRDRDLRESFKATLVDVIQGGALQEHFPRLFSIYHFESDRKKPLTRGEPYSLQP